MRLKRWHEPLKRMSHKCEEESTPIIAMSSCTTHSKHYCTSCNVWAPNLFLATFCTFKLPLLLIGIWKWGNLEEISMKWFSHKVVPASHGLSSEICTTFTSFRYRAEACWHCFVDHNIVQQLFGRVLHKSLRSEFEAGSSHHFTSVYNHHWLLRHEVPTNIPRLVNVQ